MVQRNKERKAEAAAAAVEAERRRLEKNLKERDRKKKLKEERDKLRKEAQKAAKKEEKKKPPGKKKEEKKAEEGAEGVLFSIFVCFDFFPKIHIVGACHRRYSGKRPQAQNKGAREPAACKEEGQAFPQPQEGQREGSHKKAAMQRSRGGTTPKLKRMPKQPKH